MDFSLFLIHVLCAMSLIYGSQRSRFTRPAIDSNEQLSFRFFHILQYNLETSTSKSQQIYLWRYTISIIISLLITLLIVISIISWYFMRKYRLQIDFPGDHTRNSSPNPGEHQNSREGSTELNDQETTFQGREKVFSTTLVAVLKRVPLKEE